MLDTWNRVKEEDMEVKQWILQHTKPCPKCNVFIEKNGGCNHMTCKKCKHEFCWVCFGNWVGHLACNPNVAATKHAEKFTNVRRFIEYNARYENMKLSYTLDSKNYKPMMEVKMLELDAQWVKLDFVSEAVEMLLQCRRTLMHSYIFSYLMTTIDNQMFIFEENLKYLESCTERLSSILEHEVDATNVTKMKEKIIDKSEMCKKRRRELIDHIIEGSDKNWWRTFPIPHEELLEAEAAAGEEAIQRLLY